MAGKGVLFALDAADECQLLAFPEASARASWIANVVEERWETDWLCAIDSMWVPVHFCLHGASSFPLDGAPPEAKSILGGLAVGVPHVFGIDYKDQELVRQIASALARMRDDAVWARASLVQRKDYSGPHGGNLQVAVVDAIHALADFYRRASQARRAVIFTVNA